MYKYKSGLIDSYFVKIFYVSSFAIGLTSKYYIILKII